MPQALAWNMGTMTRMRSVSIIPTDEAACSAMVCSQVERCEYTTPLGLPVVPLV